MSEHVVLDTGPLVAMLDHRDRYHGWATSELTSLQQPLATCEAVLTEACHLVRRLPKGPSAVMQLLKRQVIVIAFRLGPEQDRVDELLSRYANVPMSLADACLVRMCELHQQSRVFTLDGDFRIYRRNRRQKIPLVIPPGM